MTTPTDMYGNPTAPLRTVRSFGSEPIVAMIGTGFFTVLVLVVNALVLSSLASGLPLSPTASAIIVALAIVGASAGYATLLVFMYAARARLIVGGYAAPERWKVWAGWLIPFYNLWAPFAVMRAFRVRIKSPAMWSMKLWWGGWIASALLQNLSRSAASDASFSQLVLVLQSAVALASYVGLVIVIREVTASFARSSVANPVAPYSDATTSTTEPGAA